MKRKKIIVGVDSEFNAVLDCKTRPICDTLHSPGMESGFFIHPRACERVLATAREVGHPVFQSPCALFDYFDLEWKDKPKNCKNYQNYEVVLFWAFKDPEFLFKDEEIYRKFVLPYLSRVRRISSMHSVETNSGDIFMTDSISLPWVIHNRDFTNNDKMRWSTFSIKIIDISAMQGSESLKTYAENVGLIMESKDTYTSAEKARMEDMYCENPCRFKAYALGDAEILQEIREKTHHFYNQIAELIGIEPRPLDKTWGLSIGKVVGTMLHEWLSSELGLKISKIADEDELYKTNNLSGSEGFTNIGRLLKNKRINYLAMVDGGRAVKERVDAVFIGTLIDIDIDSCYGNGLLNQSYFAGMPHLIDKPMKLRDFVKYIDKSPPGGWYARISWKDAPFKQDLLISKTESAFQTWDWVNRGYDADGFEISDDGKKVYDAGMCLTTNSVHQASLNHDSWQVIQNYASDNEKGWLYENAIIESAALYLKKLEVKEPTDQMRAGIKLSEDPHILIEGSKEWIEVPLRPLMQVLLNERKKYPKEDELGNKKTENLPMNTFLKLIINTIYGVIASEFFSVPGSCVSNAIVGNNITERARVLSWCMAKGLHTAFTATDGGVFDINHVLKYKQTSLAIFERVHRNEFYRPRNTDGKKTLKRELIVEQVPLFRRVIEDEEAKQLKNSGELDKRAWQHLKELFGKLDIFKHEQFSFKTKDVYTKLTMHSKTDYRLEKANGDRVYALRGMPKIWSDERQRKVIDPRADILFDAIESGNPVRLDIEGTELLSLADWQTHPDKKVLLPHDMVSKNQTFYSHTPHGLRHKNLAEYKQVQRDYHSAKSAADALIRDKEQNALEDGAKKVSQVKISE